MRGDGRPLGPPARVPDLRPRRLLRLVAEPPRDRTFPRDEAPDRHIPRARGGLGLVLPRRPGALMARLFDTRHEQVFPRLTQEQIDRLAPAGTLRRVSAGEILFDPGEGRPDVHVIVSGAVEIVQVEGKTEQPRTR